MSMDKNIGKIDVKSKKYPKLLKELPDGAPEPIYYLGELPEENEVLISIVGTRKATQEGIIAAKQIAKDLAESGITIVSGLALGIDAAAHSGALKAHGKTMAVLGNGLKKIYPASHENLANDILLNGGCLISEYEPDVPPLPHQFLERNRIVSGISLATIVIEAPKKSGSLVTAKCALEQGREVFVLPGEYNHPNYVSSHELIRNGARLIRSADDVLEDLDLTHLKKTEIKLDFLNETNLTQKSIYEILQLKKASSIDEIIEITKLTPQVVNQELALLLIGGAVKEKNGVYSLI